MRTENADKECGQNMRTRNADGRTHARTDARSKFEPRYKVTGDLRSQLRKLWSKQVLQKVNHRPGSIALGVGVRKSWWINRGVTCSQIK